MLSRCAIGDICRHSLGYLCVLLVTYVFETGRFLNIPREFRLCTMCNDNVIKDEAHFIFYCNQYNDLREYLCEKICPKYQHFEIPSDAEKFNIVMSRVFVKHTAEYLYQAYYKRRSLIYN